MRKAFIPEFWVRTNIKGDTLRTLLAIALHADKNGISFVGNELLCQITNKNTRQVQYDLNRGESAGLITRKYDDKGKRYFVINMNQCSDDGILHPMQQKSMVNDCTPCKETTGGDALSLHGGVQSDCTSPQTPLYMNHCILTPYSNTASSSSSGAGDRQLEPFEAGMVPTSEPIKVRPIETRQPIRFETPDLGELKNKFFEVLGPYAESIHRKISHEMIESGFVAWLLDECKGAETPFKLFQHKLKTEWQAGNWETPEEQRRRAKAEKLRKHEEWLSTLT